MKAEPLYVDAQGRKVYRVLLFGLRWKSTGKGTHAVRALDGKDHTWTVYRNNGKLWNATLDQGEYRTFIAMGLKTRREAITEAEQEARRRVPK